MQNEQIDIKLERDGDSFFTKSFSSNNEGYIDFTVDPLSIKLTDRYSMPGAVYLRVNFFKFI
jgi:hypothetical protein